MNHDEKIKLAHQTDTAKVKRSAFLFTLDGGKAVLEYMRNVTPQVLIGSMWMLAFIRAIQLDFSVKTLFFWLLTFAITLVFFYIVIANYFYFLQPMIKNMEARINDIQDYKACETPHKFRVWFKHLFTTLKLAYRYKKILVVEFILIGILLQIPTIIVLLASAHSADQLYQALLLGP